MDATTKLVSEGVETIRIIAGLVGYDHHVDDGIPQSRQEPHLTCDLGGMERKECQGFLATRSIYTILSGEHQGKGGYVVTGRSKQI